PLDRVEHALDVQAVLERRRRVLPGRDGADEVDGLVDEAVLVAEAVAGGPPRLHVRVVRLGDEDPPEAGGGRRLGRAVVGEDVHVLAVAGARTGLAVDLDPRGVLPAPGEAGRLEDRRRTGREARREQGRVVDRHGATLGASGAVQAAE